MLHSVRFRATLIALVATAVALTLAAVLLLMIVRSTLVEEIDTSITNRAWDIAVEIDLTDVLDNTAFPNDAETFAGVIEFTPDPQMQIHNDLEPLVDEVLAQLPVSMRRTRL